MLVHDHHAAGADDGVEFLHRVKVQRLIQVLFCQTAAGRTANLNRLEGGAVFQTAADVKDNLAQGGAHGYFNQTGVLNGTGEGEGLGAGATGSADGAIPVGTLQNNFGNVGVGFHIVQNRGTLPQTLFDGSGGLDPRHTPIAFDGGSQCRAFAADESTGAPVDVKMEAEIGAQNPVTQQPPLLQQRDGMAQPGNGHGILGTDVDIAILRLYGIGGNHHALNQLKGIALHHGAVHKSAGVALVTVADHIANGILLTGNLLPFPPGREAAAASAPEAGLVDFVNDLVPGHLGHGFFQCQEATGSQIFIQRFRIQLAAVFQHNSGLLCNKGNFAGLNVFLLSLVIEQPLQNDIAQNRLLENVPAVLRLHLYILNDLVALLNPHQGAKLTEALAAGFLYANQFVVFGFLMGSKLQKNARGFLYQLLKQLVDFVASGGNAARTGADQNTAVISI